MLCNSIKIALDLKLNDFVTIYRANLKGFRCAGARNQLLSHSSVPNLTENAFREGPFKFPREDASTAALDFYGHLAVRKDTAFCYIRTRRNIRLKALPIR